MSYRDVRNFVEMMKALGYTRLLSMENFRSPNFPLVAEVLIWLVKRYEANAEIPMDIETEQDRVFFIKAVAQFMATKAHVKLNTKKLYQADGHAIREILKAVTLLYNAMRSNSLDADNSATAAVDDDYLMDISSRVGDIKEARQLASEITRRGAKLYDLLDKELELRDARNAVLSRPVDSGTIETGIRSAVDAVHTDIQSTLSSIENFASDEANLEAKIDKKRVELERSQKRLNALQQVRPTYMDEFEKLEEELSHLYAQYVMKFRNVTFLEQQLEDYQRAEQEKFDSTETSLKNMAEKLKMVGNGDLDDDDFRDLIDDDDGDDNSEGEVGGRPKRSMGRLGLDDEESDGDSDLEIDDDDDDDDDDDEDDENQRTNQPNAGPQARRPIGSGRRRAAVQQHDQLSDDDAF